MSLSGSKRYRRTIILPDVRATAQLAKEFAEQVSPTDILALTGDLGSGKTEFARSLITARGLLQGVNIDHVPSPTFTFVQYYELPNGIIYHFEL